MKSLQVEPSVDEYADKLAELDLENPKHPHLARVIDRDVERTFFGTENRKVLTRFLNIVINDFGDYHQGLGYVARFVPVLHRPTLLIVFNCSIFQLLFIQMCGCDS